MSTNENSRESNDSSNTQPIAVQPSMPLGPHEGIWGSGLEVSPAFASPAASLFVYLHGLRRHWILATALGLLLAAVLGLAVWFGWGPQYTAAAFLRVATSQERIVFETQDTERRFAGEAFDIYKDTQAQLLKSRFVLTAALRKPEVSRLRCVQRRDAEAWLGSKIKVSFPLKAEIMMVSMRGSNPEEAATLVKAVVDSYLNEVVDVERKKRRQRLSELDRAYTEKETEVRARRTDLKSLTEQLGTSDSIALAQQQQHTLQMYSSYQRELMRTEFQLRGIEGQLEAQNRLLQDVDGVEVSESELAVALRTDPVAKQLADEYTWRQMDKNRMDYVARKPASSGYTEKYVSDLQMVESQFNERREELREEIRDRKRAEIEARIREMEIEAAVLTAQVSTLKSDVEKQRQETTKIGLSSTDVEMMRAELAQLGQVLSGIATEREKLKVELRSASRITLLQTAEPPKSEALLPARIALTGLVMIVGLCLPGGLIVWWDSQAKHINSSSDVSKGLGLTVIGSVPKIPGRVIRRLGSPSKQHQKWHMRLTESVDGVAARLLRKAELEQARVVLVSSAMASEGKTTLATQLAMSLARSGRRTVLVDFDLRRPAFDGVFGLPLEPGTSEVLRGEGNVIDCVHPTGTDNLSVVTAGRWNRDTLSALANGAAESLIEQLLTQFEFVVIDAGPILPVADTRFLSQHVDAVILSVFRDISQAPQIREAREILEAFGVRTLEAVVTGPCENIRDKDLGYASSVAD